jgi:hypothetical protein
MKLVFNEGFAYENESRSYEVHSRKDVQRRSSLSSGIICYLFNSCSKRSNKQILHVQSRRPTSR